MAPIKAEAIILKRNDFREQSVILSLYTKNDGKIRGLLKGVRSPKSKIPPLTFTAGSRIFTLYYRSRSELNLLSYPVLTEYYGMPGQKHLKIWHSVLKLTELFTPEKLHDVRLFNLLSKTGRYLACSENPEILFVAFKLRFIEILGYGIELKRCVVCNVDSGNFLYSSRLGGTVCKICCEKEKRLFPISMNNINIMKQLMNMEYEKIKVIKKIPGTILHRINFYSNITLHYHTGMDQIWWQNEKSIL